MVIFNEAGDFAPAKSKQFNAQSQLQTLHTTSMRRGTPKQYNFFPSYISASPWTLNFLSAPPDGAYNRRQASERVRSVFFYSAPRRARWDESAGRGASFYDWHDFDRRSRKPLEEERSSGVSPYDVWLPCVSADDCHTVRARTRVTTESCDVRQFEVRRAPLGTIREAASSRRKWSPPPFSAARRLLIKARLLPALRNIRFPHYASVSPLKR